MSQAVVYLRENPSLPSIEIQKKACHYWADLHDTEIVKFVVETELKFQPLRHRAKLLRLLLDFTRGQTLLLYSRDSLNLKELSLALVELEISEKRGIIRSCSEPDLCYLLCPERRQEITEIVNHYRSQLLGGKIKTSLQNRLDNGLKAGNVKLGEQADEQGFLSVNSSEIEAVKLVKNLRTQGFNVYEIQDELAEQGITCRSGQTPSIPTISRWSYHRLPNEPARKVKVKLEDKMPHLATEILRLRDEGKTFQQICHELALIGYYSRNGKPFMPTQIRRIYNRVS